MFTGENIYKEHLGLTCPLSAAFTEQGWENSQQEMIGNH
jgi:hypothetical protein